MAEIHRLTPTLARYTAVSEQHDPEGRYQCSRCMMYVPLSTDRSVGGCTAVLPDPGEQDCQHILGAGGCNLYVRGPAAKAENTNPNRLTKDEAGYLDGGPFSCARCGNYLGGGYAGCVRVMAKGEVKTIEPGECCDGWSALDSVPEEVRALMRSITRRQGERSSLSVSGTCPACGFAVSDGLCLRCGMRVGKDHKVLT